MRHRIAELLDRLFGSHIVKLDNLERDLYDCKVRIAKLDAENQQLKEENNRLNTELVLAKEEKAND